MKGIREIRGRIKSVKNTAQITRAMQLVAASKMKRAQTLALQGRPYALLMAEIIVSVLRSEDILEHPLFRSRPIQKRGILLIGTDKGLCGPLNTNLFKHLSGIEGNAAFVTVGKKATQYLARAKREVIAEFIVSDRASFSELRPAAEFLLKAYLEGRIDSIEVLYTRFINTLCQEPCLQPLLPIGNIAETLNALRSRWDKEGGFAHRKDEREMLFEPNPRAILEVLPELFIKQEIYQMLLESKASEHSARMVAMKSATDNANQLVDDLTLEYNKARQAGITQEILEIAAASLQSV